MVETITAEAVDKALAAPAAKLHERIYHLRRQKGKALITEKLLIQEAAKRGVSVQTLLDTEVIAQVGLVSEPEIEAFYQANNARLQGDEAAIREQRSGPTSKIRSWRPSGRHS
jgi:hypothetical protein